MSMMDNARSTGLSRDVQGVLFNRPEDRTLEARHCVGEYVRKYQATDSEFSDDQTYVVWFSYILGGWKALVSTERADEMYYEVTYNRNKDETYLDVYKKIQNIVILN